MRNDIFGIHTHHIVFRSQGGLDFNLNLMEMTMEEHEGDNGPHKNREKDMALKKELQEKLFELFPEGDYFDIDTISRKLGRTRRYFDKHFRKVTMVGGLFPGEEVVRRLMGGKLY